MFHSPEQYDKSWSEAKSVTELSDDEVRQLFDAKVAKLNEEQRSASVSGKSVQITQSFSPSRRGRGLTFSWWKGLTERCSCPPG
jgi:hypothetical protein